MSTPPDPTRLLGFSDQAWATVLGLTVVVVMRLLDYLIPKGYAFRKTVQKWSVRVDDDARKDEKEERDESDR